MFETDLTELSTADLLASAADQRTEANRRETSLLEHALVYADRHHPDTCPPRPGRASWQGRERAVVLGGDGCPEVAEFASAEFGAMLGISAGAGANLIGQALALRHRLPFTLARVRAGDATPWRACRIATACLALSQEAAALVDKQVAPIIDTLTPERLEKIVKAAKWRADPDAARAAAEERARERGVYVGRSDEHGTKRVYIRAASGDVIRFDATVASIAEALKVLGDTDTLGRRRAKAIGIIADPVYTEELLRQAQTELRTKTNPAGADATSPGPTGADTASAAPTGAKAEPEPAPEAAPATGPDAETDPGAEADTETNPAAPIGAEADPAGPIGTSTEPAAPPADPTRPNPDDQPGRPKPHPGPESGPSAQPEPGPKSKPRAESGPGGRPEPEPGADPAPKADPEPGSDPEPEFRPEPQPEFGHEPEPVFGSEPGPDDEADRDAPHPSHSDLPDPLDTPTRTPGEPRWPGPRVDADAVAPEPGEPLGAAAQRDFDARLAQIKQDAYATRAAVSGAGRGTGSGVRPGKSELYVHLTDLTLATGDGILRVEGLGPMLASQLAELVGHGPYIVKPVIDLNDAANVDCYEIPDWIRERVKLIHPVEQFPYGTRETDRAMDLDHIQPYDSLGPPGQTGTENLAPLRRYSHRVKTHGRWKVRRLDRKTLEWTTPHGYRFHVTPTGTRRVTDPTPDS